LENEEREQRAEQADDGQPPQLGHVKLAPARQKRPDADRARAGHPHRDRRPDPQVVLIARLDSGHGQHRALGDPLHR